MSQKICIIFGAGDLYEQSTEIHIPQSAVVIAADGGLEHTRKLGITPDYILGDFDSCERPPERDDCIVYPTEKDYSDMHLAVEKAYSLGIRTMEIYGALGGKRLEHTVANLQLISAFAKKGCLIKLHGDGEIVFAVHSDGREKNISFDKNASGYISIFAFGEKAHGVSLSGLKYPLENYELSPDFPLGLSNEFTGLASNIFFKSGTLLIICGENISFYGN